MPQPLECSSTLVKSTRNHLESINVVTCLCKEDAVKSLNQLRLLRRELREYIEEELCFTESELASAVDNVTAWRHYIDYFEDLLKMIDILKTKSPSFREKLAIDQLLLEISHKINYIKRKWKVE